VLLANLADSGGKKTATIAVGSPTVDMLR